MAKDLGTKIREITEEEVDKAIELADSNHDGVISKQEMTHWVAYYMTHCER
jgi:Ca2+-binding EF-hand superfamily protein